MIVRNYVIILYLLYSINGSVDVTRYDTSKQMFFFTDDHFFFTSPQDS